MNYRNETNCLCFPYCSFFVRRGGLAKNAMRARGNRGILELCDGELTVVINNLTHVIE